jgi:hypothetical protein
MTDIEELVREALRTAPPVSPSSSDPVAAVSGRVRRVRALFGGGLAVVAMVVAAVVVPLSLRDSAGGRLVPATPSPNAVHQGSTVWSHDAVAVTAGGGFLWVLERDPKANDGRGFLVKLDPQTHQRISQWDVAAPFDFMTFGLGHVWVWGGGDGGYPDGEMQTFDASSSDGCPCNSIGNKDHGYGGVAFLAGHPWVTTGSAIWEMSVDGERVLWSRGLGQGSTPGAVFAAGGRLFVQMSPTSMQQLIPESDGVGARLGEASAVSDGTERFVAVEGSDTLLISTGPNIEQWRSHGTEFVSNAVFDSWVGSAVALPNGDVVVSTLGTEDGSVRPGVWLARADARGLLCPDCVTRIAEDASVVSLVANPLGGVDFVLDDGTAEHWQP